MDEDDIALSHVLLAGFVEEDELGLPHQRYLTDEHEARMAIARLLRSQEPLPRRIRDALAGMFEPVPSDYTDPGARVRVLKIQFRSAARRPDNLRNSVIMQYAYDAWKSGVNVETAIGEAAQKFVLSEDTVWDIWSGFGGWERAARLFR
jgi:hypothetical protein